MTELKALRVMMGLKVLQVQMVHKELLVMTELKVP
jgi:hypothetical protein